MPDHAAFLKGINLGKRRLTNDELRSHVESLGLAEVAIFRASGNVVFSDQQGRPDEALQAMIEAGLADLLGYEVKAFVRSGRELAAVAESDPFDGPTSSRLKGKLQVMFLGGRPAKKIQAQVLALAGTKDALGFGRTELLWLPAAGVSDSKLDFKALERLLGPVTVRTMGTVQQIVAKHFAA